MAGMQGEEMHSVGASKNKNGSQRENSSSDETGVASGSKYSPCLFVGC